MKDLSYYIDLVQRSYSDYWNYLVNELLNPAVHNYVYLLIAVSLLFFLIEIIRPWRKDQGVFRRDFWLDVFYMFFNFFLFSLIIYNAASNVFVDLFNTFLNSIGVENLISIEVSTWSVPAQLLTLFILRDFIQWNIHRLLHRVSWLWEFHKVHHSVKEMGFAAHLRYHWMENIVYRVLEYIPLAMIGFGIADFFLVHAIALSIGHFNHSNFYLPLGPLKYIFNNPQMHIWHHAKYIDNRPYGINFGLSLSIWDYLFGTAVIPHDGKDIELGFEKDESFPQTFIGQNTYPWNKNEEAGS